MKSHTLIAEDTVALRGIVDFLAYPADIREISTTLHMGGITAGRLCKALQQARIIEHTIAIRNVLGVDQAVPQIREWKRTEAYTCGEIDFNAEKLAEVA